MKVQELSAVKCVCFFLSLKCYPFIQIFFHCLKAFGLVSVCHIYDHSDYCKLNLNVECCNNMHVNLPVLILEF